MPNSRLRKKRGKKEESFDGQAVLAWKPLARRSRRALSLKTPGGMAKDRQKKAFSVARKFSGARKSLFAPPDYFLTPEKAFF
jgi:hypothetical protein